MCRKQRGVLYGQEQEGKDRMILFCFIGCLVWFGFDEGRKLSKQFLNQQRVFAGLCHSYLTVRRAGEKRVSLGVRRKCHIHGRDLMAPELKPLPSHQPPVNHDLCSSLS